MVIVLGVILFLLLGLTLFLCCLFNGSGPIRLFTSCVSRKEFRLLTEVIFANPNVYVLRDQVTTKEYTIKNAEVSSLQHFSINEVSHFSFAQKIHFLKRHNKYFLKKNGNPRDNRRKKLNLHKLTPAGQVLYKDNK